MNTQTAATIRAAAAPEPLLAVHQLSRHFLGVRALDEVDLTLAPGVTLGLIGPNGAGKTTFFNLLSGLTPPTAGRAIFKGKNLAGLAPSRVTALGISRTFQNIRLFPGLTVLEHVQVGAHCRLGQGLWGSLLRTGAQQREELELRQRAFELLHLVGLAQEADIVATSLPYGHQRRVEIARALAPGPDLLLLDEPAAGMNPTERSDLRALIRSIRSRVQSIILIEHDVEFVMDLCDRIAVLNFGRLIADGTPGAVRSHPDVIEAYLGQETEVGPC